MPALTKELLLDYAINKLTVEEKADIENTISALYYNGALTGLQIKMLYAYIYGYTGEEIAQLFHMSIVEVEVQLTAAVTQIGNMLQVHDESLVKFAKRNNYPPSKMEDFIVFLHVHGSVYKQHSVNTTQYKL
jgi:hypothetical protein